MESFSIGIGTRSPSPFESISIDSSCGKQSSFPSKVRTAGKFWMATMMGLNRFGRLEFGGERSKDFEAEKFASFCYSNERPNQNETTNKRILWHHL
jgi:hypothetical protein